MRLQGAITINGRMYAKGSDVPWYTVYPFFLIHMLVFGGSGFTMAYASKHTPLVFLYLHGGFAIAIYTVMYVVVFGRDEVKWMFINAVLGIVGIASQIDWLLSWFGKKFSDYPWYVHVIPFLYYVLYTFLLRHAVIDLTRSRDHPESEQRASLAYLALSVVIYVVLFFWHR